MQQSHHNNNGKYPTSYEKRKLLYERKLKQQQSHNQKHALDLPSQYRNKISTIQYKKIKEAFYIHSTADIEQQLYTLNRDQMVSCLRSLGVVMKTVQLYEMFEEYRSRTIGWEWFLRIYLSCRSHKGSYNELNQALEELEKEYRGDWEYLEEDLMNIGDVLTEEELMIFSKEVIGDQPLTKETLINTLLGYNK